MSATFTDRFGQEYEVVFDGKQPLLPPRRSKPNPLSACGWSMAEVSGMNEGQNRRGLRYREKKKAEKVRAELAGILR